MAISVPFEALESGMVLAEPVINRFGQLLIAQGARLSTRHLNVLKTWGVQMILIQGGEPNGDHPVINEEIRTRATALINKRLFWHPNNPLEEEVIDLALQQAIRRVMEMGSEGSPGREV